MSGRGVCRGWGCQMPCLGGHIDFSLAWCPVGVENFNLPHMLALGSGDPWATTSISGKALDAGPGATAGTKVSIWSPLMSLIPPELSTP